MYKGFVFGKFLPFHKGHEAMIRFALDQCDFLSVLICCSDKEKIPAALRKSWMEETFPNEPKIRFQILNYKEDELPNTSVSSESVSEIWSQKFMELFPDYQAVITSELYGDYIASFMKIDHIPFDPPRVHYPVSATQIRKNPFLLWNFLPESVKPHYCLKVVILGTESTGKTTLTQNLAKALNAAFVLEAGRDVIPDSTAFTSEDIHRVAIEHAARISAAQRTASPLIIIDTDIHITKSYARFSLGFDYPIPDEIYHVNRAQLYLYLNNDVPFIQDGTRLGEEDRDLLDASHRQILAEQEVNYVEVRGSWEERLEQALAEIRKLTEGITFPGRTFS